ncbi:MAG: pantetheine-phosphate adenylyltransferase [Crocinitomicaceae bacterium]|nr:pantetheine-phosphate adenylyltransferase [Crocinitomicaceae bacterium]
MKKIALFPGSFDPFTKGHESVIQKALPLFDEIVIGIGINTSKSYFFELEKRKAHIEQIYASFPSVKVTTYQKLTVEYCKDIDAKYILRGLRDTNDFEYEKAIAQMNLQISGIETVFFMTDPAVAPISATIVREISRNNGDITPFVSHFEQLI